ncbi:MAG: hypothetical protein GY754_02160 [bacterium]|nr:hypothetical protein [bacterium]
MIEKEIPVSMFYRIRYQRCDEEKGPDWKKVHVYPSRHMYECFQDMRKIFKMSISAVIAFAIRKYLPALLEDPAAARVPRHIDNYLDQYLFLGRDSGGIQKFVIYFGFAQHRFWGYPGEEGLNSYFTETDL